MSTSSRMPKPAYAEGPNYRVDLEGGFVRCKVWARADLDRETGARCAQEKIDVFRQLVGLSKVAVPACLFDLREAPVSWGPATQAALEQCVAVWEGAGRKIAVLTSDDPLQCLHVRLLVKKQAPSHGHTFTDEETARAWLVG